MAHVQKRVRKNTKGQERVRWVARHTGPDGRERCRTFDRKTDADTWLSTQVADTARGQWLDPAAGKVTFRTFAERWLAMQTTDPATREAVTSRVNVHVMPTFGPMELRAIRPSAVQAWLRELQGQLAPRYLRVILANLSSILGAAVEDGIIAKNPCSSRSVRAPAVEQERVIPWPTEQVGAVVDAHPERYQAVPVLAAGAGLRQGECFGLDVEAVDFLGRRLMVRQQVKLLSGKPILAPPKGGRTREIPLADAVAYALSERLRLRPAREVTLPWKALDGEPRTVRLVFTTREGGPLVRRYFNTHVWKPALRAVEVEATRKNGLHALRHYYASVLLEAGVSIRTVAEYLGHADPGFTLRTYTHLMPESESRARQAVDAALGRTSDGTETGRAAP